MLSRYVDIRRKVTCDHSVAVRSLVWITWFIAIDSPFITRNLLQSKCRCCIRKNRSVKFVSDFLHSIVTCYSSSCVFIIRIEMSVNVRNSEVGAQQTQPLRAWLCTRPGS